MRLTIDVNRCCASGNCVLIAPEIFDQTEDDGLAVLLVDEPPSELEVVAREAAEVCPVAAIRVEDEIAGSSITVTDS